MAIGVLVLGESGTGKSFSIKGFSPEEVKVLSVHKPILPFRGKYEVVHTPTGEDVIREMKNTTKKNIVIDDFQYILGLPMMRRIGEKGWEKYNEIQQPYSDVLDTIPALPDDTIVYFMSHTETNGDGKVKIKTIGNALDKYLSVEGLFMVVFGTCVINNHYYFTTQNNGNNTVKTPFEMFDDIYIPNDLKYVEDKIRNYYYMDNAKSDEEIKTIDEQHKVEQPSTERKKRERKSREPEKPAKEILKSESDENPFEGEQEKPKRRKRKINVEVDDEDVPF